MGYLYFLYTLSRRFVGLTWQIDGLVSLHGLDAQFQFGSALGKSPQTIEERTTVVEIIGYQTTIGIKTGTVATIGNAEEG